MYTKSRILSSVNKLEFILELILLAGETYFLAKQTKFY